MYQVFLLVLLPEVYGSFGPFPDIQQIQQAPDDFSETGPSPIAEPPISQELVQQPAPTACYEPPIPDGNMFERLSQLTKPAEPSAIGVDRLNQVMNRVGRELHFLSEKSRECLADKIKGLNQLKQMRDGLKNAYRDIYNLQGTLNAYQTQLREMQDYIDSTRGRVAVVDNKQLGEMYGMVRRLQSAAENMISVSVRTQKPVST